MKATFRALLVLGFGVLAFLPSLTMAQGQQESLTIQLNLSTPSGIPLTGTFVARRTLGTPITAAWTFSGLLQGQPFKATGTAVDRWLGDGKEEIEMTSYTSWESAVPQPPLMTISLQQVGDGVIAVEGIPLAVNGKLLPPGSGNQVFMATNAGQGARPVTSLPNTTDFPHLTSLMIGGAVLSGAAILCLALSYLLLAPRRPGRNVAARS